MEAVKVHETKVFKSGNSQAVRIPKDFQLDTESVFIRKNEAGELVISTHASKWNQLFNFINKNEAELKGFMDDREDLPPEDKEIF